MPECTNPLHEELKAYVDGELSAFQRTRVEQHLKACSVCRAEREALAQLTQTLATAFPEPAPLPTALRARILRQLPEPASVRPLPFWRRRGPQAMGGVLAFACALWLWVRVPTETLQEKALSSATVSAPAASVAAGALTAKKAEDKVRAPQAAPPPVRAAAMPSRVRAGEAAPLTSPKGTPSLALPAAPPVHVADSPKQELAPSQPESRMIFGATSKTLIPPAKPSGGPPGGGIAGGGRGGFGGGNIGGGSTSFKAKAIPPQTTELTLTVAAGKTDATVTELKKRIEALGGSATVTEKPKKLTVTLPSEKALQLRSQLEVLGKVVPLFVDAKRDEAVESLVITLQEESGN